MTKSALRHPATGLLVLALVLAPFALTACGGGGGGGDPDPGPDPVPLTVAASPLGGILTAATDVTLAAAGDGSATATIYYTMDLSEPTDASTEYTGPINVADDTILKFIAMATDGTTTAVSTEGYVVAPPGSIKEQWANSGHGMIMNEAWRHWDEDPEVSSSCAQCHSGDGFMDYAMDGTVDAGHPQALGLTCAGCHGDPFDPLTLYGDTMTYAALEPVEFPSGASVSLFGTSNLCITCHQGRASKDDVDGATPNDVVQAPMDFDSFDFINIHYYAAAASYFGSEVRGGFQYAGLTYQARNTFPSHPDELSTCVGCHMGDTKSHTWEPDLATCTDCHGGTSFETLGGSPGDNYTKIQTLLGELLTEIQTYATALGFPVVYDDHAYPYFFNDNGAGANFGNRYRHFDRQLLQAAYNYQVGQKEPCGYLHNGTYIQQILHDSIVDLGGAPSVIPPGRNGFVADAGSLFIQKTQQFHLAGHDNADDEAFRHWDMAPAYDPHPPGEVSDSCARCHTAPGFADQVDDGVVGSPHLALSTVGCIACHNSANLFASTGGTTETRWDDLTTNSELANVTFPSGATASLGGPSNICMTCHQGRSSTDDVDATIAADANGDGTFSFINVHYLPAGATLFGNDVRGGYQYSGKTYVGQTLFSSHGPALKTCAGCHMRGGANDHTFVPNLTQCIGCHGGTSFETLGIGVDTGLGEIQTLLGELLTAIQDYALNTLGEAITYEEHTYPYFFDSMANAYVFDATLVRAAYNYQYGIKETCGYIHNADYVRQLLYDAIENLGDTPSVSRP